MSSQICIVNADPNEFGVLATLLRQNLYEVEILATGRAALNFVPERQPDVVILAVELPDRSGLEICAELHADPRSEHIPIIFLGSSDDLKTKVEALETGGVDFVALPFEADEILARVKRQATVAKVRAALQESEAEFRSVTQSAIDAIISADSKGLVRSWNPAATRLFGFPESEMIGQPLNRIIPDRFRTAHHEGVNRVSSGGPSHVIGSTVEVAAIRNDDSEIPVELSLATWTLDDKRYYTGILRDISERKEAEQKFRSVTDSAIDAIVSSDNTSTVVGWNKAAERLFGWTSEEIIGKPLETIIPERYRAAHSEGMNRVTTGGESRAIGQTVELSALHSDGKEFPIELSLSSWMVEDERYYTGIIRDISERKEAEEKLKKYAEELERQHEELQRQHEELQRSREALAASFSQAQRLFSAVTDGLPGAVLNDKYRLDRKIASGGFGVVYEATQIALERRVAVKLLRPPTGEIEEALYERFRREGITACRINHLNAVAVLDLDVSEGGFPYIVMEYLEGTNLGERLGSAETIQMKEALGIMADVCNVLAATHRAGVLHRDIKPSNIFLQEVGEEKDEHLVKVLDFGVAKLMDEPGRYQVTQTGELLGTPSYMAPERLRHDSAEGTASDVYAAAIVVYECLAGRLPIDPEPSLIATIKAQLETKPRFLTSLRPAVPVALSEVLVAALSRNPDRRPSVDQLEKTLREVMQELPDTDSDGGPPGSRSRFEESPTQANTLTRIVGDQEVEN